MFSWHKIKNTLAHIASDIWDKIMGKLSLNQQFFLLVIVFAFI